MKLHLPDVTLVAIDTACHELTALAVNACLEMVQFGAVRICTNNDAPFRRAGIHDCLVAVAPFSSINDAMSCLWYQVADLVETSHALVMQWDSGIINQARWSERFLDYDYVGAPWGWHGDQYEVGNGGFSLRSRRLMRYIAERKRDFPLADPEDNVLCRRYRPALEREGFRWAPTDLALQFSFERIGFSGIDHHFGYHGIFNWPRVFSTEALHERILLMLNNRYLNQPKHLTELLQAATNQQIATHQPSPSALQRACGDR